MMKTRTFSVALAVLALAWACRAERPNEVLADGPPSSPTGTPPPARDAPRVDELSTIELGPPLPSAERVALLLHGYGDRAEAFRGVAARLRRDARRTRFVVVDATFARPEGGRMWWPIDLARVRGLRRQGRWPELEREAPPGLSRTRAAIAALISRLAAGGASRDKLVVAGFSQGAMLAVDTALHHPARVHAAVAWSGAIVDRAAWEERAPAADIRFDIVHGTRDPILPVEGGRSLHRLLRSAGRDSTFHEFDGPHRVSDEGLRALASRLR